METRLSEEPTRPGRPGTDPECRRFHRLSSLLCAVRHPSQSCLSTVYNLRSSPTFQLRSDLLSGITVAVMQVPESVAFSFVAGVDPIVGLYST